MSSHPGLNTSPWHSSYVLPVHSALVDITGQILLVSAYFLADRFGGDVKIHDLSRAAAVDSS